MTRHIPLQRVFAFAALTICTSWAYAQQMGDLQLSSSKISPGQSISMALAVDFSNAKTPLCAIEVNYGDGNSETLRVEQSMLRNNQLPLQHTYHNEGNYTLRIEGRTMFRGFKTAMACQGPSLVRSLTVTAYKAKTQQDTPQPKAKVQAKAKAQQPKPKAPQQDTHKASPPVAPSAPVKAPVKAPEKAAVKPAPLPTAKPDAPAKKKPVIKPF